MPTRHSTQLLCVLAEHEDATTGHLQAFERPPGGPWQAVGEVIPVTLGRSGLAWGRGLHPAQPGRQKQEGDGRAPVGVFALTALFGATPNGDYRLPYHPAHPDLKCVDDPASRHYNCLVDARHTPRDWASCEDMLRADARYALGAVVAHNSNPPLPGAGSCIFLHVWESPGAPTAGCTAMSLAHMRQLAHWLDAARQPVLAQLAEADYAALQVAWDLPRR